MVWKLLTKIINFEPMISIKYKAKVMFRKLFTYSYTVND